MTIKIIPDGPQEYNQAFMFFAGTVPTFEEWVRQKKGNVTENVLIQG